jgi:hypothetical protein
MTLDTKVYILDRADYKEVFVKCNQLIGATEGTRFTDKDGSISNAPGQGLCAWLFVYHGNGAPLVADGGHHRYCEPDDEEESHRQCFPRWLEVSLDTGYGYRGPDGGGCGELHARLVAELGQWLDGRSVRWSWLNEFTGEIHPGYEGLTELAGNGAEARQWFRDIVAPAIGATADSAREPGILHQTP